MTAVAPKSPTASSADTKRKITAASFCNAHVLADTIDVAVTGTAVELTGSVRSWAEYCQARYAAWCSPGVTEVANQLIVAS